MTATFIIVLTILFTFLIQIKPVKTIACYTCIDCDDPFDPNSPNVTQSLASCYYCYKLTVFMAYAPRYIIKECVQTCTSTNGMWGGSSIEVNCCASSLCNNASGLYFQYAWKNRFLFTIISSLFMTLLSII